MSIQKQIRNVLAIAIIVPMTLFLVVSTMAFDEQVQRNEQAYLEVAMRFVRSTLDSRKSELQKSAKILGGQRKFQALLLQEDSVKLKNEITMLADNFPYLDVLYVVDKDNNLVAKRNVESKYENGSAIKEMAAKAMRDKEINFAELVLPLDQLFTRSSTMYDKFSIRIRTSTDGEEQYLRKALIGVNVVPVFSAVRGEEVIDAIILGDILNNDANLPITYSRNVPNSYLAVSIDGIRVASNITVNGKTDYIGSRLSGKYPIINLGDRLEFGRDLLNNEVHVFLDEALVNTQGEKIATFGVGIPQEKFNEIISYNYGLVGVITVLALLLMFFVGRKIATVISAPITSVTNMARNYSKIEFEKLANEEYDTDDEGMILDKTFRSFINALSNKEQERKQFLKQVLDANAKQNTLTEELKKNNERLEQTVLARTAYLQDTIKELKNANLARTNFIANMSHELRTPLNVILGSAEMLQEKIWGPLTEKQSRYIDNITNSGGHLLDLINDVLDISKIASGKMELSAEPFYVEQLIRQTVLEIETYVKEKNLQVKLSIEPKDFKIVADQVKIRQIMYNLLSNSAKFTGQDGHIGIKVVKKDSIMEVSVKDDGIGIAEENLEKIFYEFEQVDNPYRKKYEGTGLGLPLVKKLVEMHGGTVRIRSGLGIGTEVVFSIPLGAEHLEKMEENLHE